VLRPHRRCAAPLVRGEPAENIEPLNLPFDRFVPLHGRVVPFSDL
jgi:hypothetical protein